MNYYFSKNLSTKLFNLRKSQSSKNVFPSGQAHKSQDLDECVGYRKRGESLGETLRVAINKYYWLADLYLSITFHSALILDGALYSIIDILIK